MMDAMSLRRCRFVSNAVLVGVVTLTALIGGCADAEPLPLPPPSPPAAPQEQGVKAAADLIDRLPAWTGKPYGAPETAALVDAATRLTSLPSDDVRKAIVYLTHPDRTPGGDLDSASRVYVVLRAMFRVPATLDMAKAKAFGGWIRPEDPQGRYPALWPIQEKDGKIVGVAPCMGYVGAPYDGAAEFDFFKAQFPLRK